MNYLVIGGGALGCWLGHALTRAGRGVRLVETDPARRRRLEQPVALVGHRLSEPVQLRGASWESLEGPFEVAILAVKPAEAEATVRMLAERFPSLPLVIATGGLEGLRLGREWGAEVIQAVVNSEMRLLEGGEVETAFANFIWLGNVAGTLTPLMEEVQRDLSWAAPSLTTRATVGMVWSKAAFSLEAGLPALLDQHPAEFYAQPSARSIAMRLVREVLAVAERFGIAPIGFDFFDPPLYRAHGAGQSFTLDTWIKNAWIRHEQYRVGSAYAFPATCGLGHSLSPRNPGEELTSLFAQLRQAASAVGVGTLALQAYERLFQAAKAGDPVSLEGLLGAPGTAREVA